MKQVFSLYLLLSVCITLSAQQKMSLTLQNALHLAQTRSLQSFLVKNTYLAGYWQYKSYQANYLPELSLNSNLVSYANANQLRYNSTSKNDEFVRTETLYSDAALALKQNVGITGGTFFVESSLNRSQNFGETPYTQFSSRPFRIGYQQELFGYNEFKWERKLEPKLYEQAMRQYLHNVEGTNQEVCNYFFNLAIASVNLDMSRYNYQHTDTLVQVARKRFQLGTIQKDELLQLELNLNNRSIEWEEAQMVYRKRKEALISFLRLPAGTEIQIVLPDVKDLKVPESEALELARERNAVMLENQIKLLKDQASVAETRARNRFQANLNISYGINKVDGFYNYANEEAHNGTIGNVYQPDFDQYQELGIQLGIPILDWGRRKGQYELAKSKQTINRLAVEQATVKFEQDVMTKVLEFNLQYNKVQSAAKSDTLAMDSYKLTSTRFRKGNVDVLKLTSAQKEKDAARLNYIRSLYDYWADYYAVRHYTLYDFENNKMLEEDFEVLLNSLK